MKISPDQVKKIAALARLELNPSEVEVYRGQLSQILDFVERLNSLDVSQIEPTAHAVSVANPTREAEGSPFTGQESVLKEAPDREGRFFRVPKVL